MPDRDSRFRRTLRITRHRRDLGRDVADELEFWIDERVAELVAQGMERAAARRQAEAAFGDRERVAAECRLITRPAQRRAHLSAAVGSLLGDVRHALRGLRRDRSFAMVSVLTLVIGIGANTAIFSVVHAVLLRPLPYADPDRLVRLYNSYPGVGIERMDNSVPDYYDRRASVAALSGLAAFVEQSVSLDVESGARNTFSMSVTPTFFDVLGVPALLGRGFTAAEGEPGSDGVAVISYALWQERFGGDAEVLGAELRTSGRPRTIVGVMPPGFTWPRWEAHVWVPLAFSDWDRAPERRHRADIEMIGHLAAGATLEQAQAQLDSLDAAVLETYPVELRVELEGSGYYSTVTGLQADLVRDVRASLLLLWAGALFLLLIACVNLTNLQLVRATARQRELATRIVLGAGRGRLMRQLVTESSVLVALGAAGGVALAAWSLRGIELFESYQVPRIEEVGLDSVVMTAVVGVCALIGVISGAAPGLLFGRRDLQSAMRGGAGASSSRSIGALRSGMVAVQVAAAFALLLGAALLVSSIAKLQAVDPGFEPDNLMLAAITVPAERYDRDARLTFVDEYLDSVRAIPGVAAAAIATGLPFSGQGGRDLVFVEGHTPATGESRVAHHSKIVSPQYFAALEIPFVRGRDFSDGDHAGAPRVAIVDEHLAAYYWPNESPLGKRMATGPQDDAADWITVVGVVGNIIYDDLAVPDALGSFYLPHSQSGVSFVRVAVRTEVDPWAVVPEMRSILGRQDPQMPLFWTTTMRDSVEERLLPRRLPMQMLIGFASAALFLSFVGVYGVLAFSVGQRTKEFGIRIALGSSRRRIFGLVARQALTVLAVGLLLGAVCAGWLTRLVADLLYEVGPADPIALLAVVAVLAAAVLVACILPTRRATGVNPVTALADE